MSLVNFGEVLYNLERRDGRRRAAEALAELRTMRIRLVEASLQRVFHAARLKARYRLGYADSFAAALAQESGGTLVTGDRDFEAVGHLIAIDWLPAA